MSSLPVPHPGSSLSVALLASGPHRRVLGHWLAWWHDISAVPYTVSDPTVGERKLAWWMQAVIDAHPERTAAHGTERGARSTQHPTLAALLSAPDAPAQAPPLTLWLSQIQGQQQLLQQTRWLDEPTLRKHMQATTGAACEGAAWLAGARDPALLALASDFGVALRRAHVLFRLGQDARAGWLHLPIDFLQAHDVKAHELLKPMLDNDGHPSPPVQTLLAEWQALSREALTQALAQYRRVPRQQRQPLRPLQVLAKLYLALLDDLDEAHYPVFKHRLSLGPWRKLWIAQRARWA